MTQDNAATLAMIDSLIAGIIARPDFAQGFAQGDEPMAPPATYRGRCVVTPDNVPSIPAGENVIRFT